MKIFIQESLFLKEFNQNPIESYDWVLIPQNYPLGTSAEFNNLCDIAIVHENFAKLNTLQKIKNKLLVVDQNDTPIGLAQLGFNACCEIQEFIHDYKKIIENTFSKNANDENLKDSQYIMKDLAMNEYEIKSLEAELVVKSEILQQLKAEEKIKKHREKKLNHILDYLNLNYGQSDFVENLCEILWKEVKKQGVFLSMGFYVSIGKSENVLITYNRESAVFFESVNLPFHDLRLAAKEVETYLQRPYGFMVAWSSSRFDHQSYIFLESKIQKPDLSEIDSYFSEIADLIVLMIQRFYSQQQVNNLMSKWNLFGESYSQPLHVIDDEFNLIRSNYLQKQDQNASLKIKCYEVLASRKSCCDHCPVLQLKKTENQKQDEKITDYVNFFDKKFKVNAVKFFSDKNYYFVFYEDQHEVDQLRSQVILNEKMNVIGQLANHLAHELNNPLTGLKLTTEYLLDQEIVKNTSIKNDFLEILKGIDRSQNIISDLLQFSSDQQSQLVESNIDEVIKKTMPLLKTITRTHNTFIDVKNVPIKMSINQTQQVVFNLIKNACQAMVDKGSIKIYDVVSANHYDVYFEDTGPGIPEKMKNQLFQAFSTSKQQNEGTGLGLFLSKKIMNRMGADLIYDDQYKNGARFILRFNKG